jgi:ABC-2 type transport system permease protein
MRETLRLPQDGRAPAAAALYWQIARRSFRRFSTYRSATFAGAFTNTVFGFLRAYVLLAVFAHRADVGGFDAADTVTYVFLTQGLWPTIGMFGALELAAKIRTGDIVSDLYRPVDFQGYWAASEVGRAGFHAIFRGVPPVLAGALAFDLNLPSTAAVWLVFLASAVLAFVASFAFTFLMSLIGFWLLDTRGAEQLLNAVRLFFGGFVVPVTFFPDALGAVARALPFVTMIQLPVEAFLGKYTSGPEIAGLLLYQLCWAVALLGAGRLVMARGVRKLVVQGG